MKFNLVFALLTLATVTAPMPKVQAQYIYNSACSEEIDTYQQSSNSEDITAARHALLLCLADGSYANNQQIPSTFETCPTTKHFKLYPSQTEIAVADDADKQILPQTSDQEARAGTLIDAAALQPCAHGRGLALRGPGDLTGPRKAEGIDWYMTINLNQMVAGNAPEFSQVQDLLQEMQNQGSYPFTVEHHAANVVRNYADFNGGLLAAPTNPPVDLGVTWPSRAPIIANTTNDTTGSSGLCCCDRTYFPIKRAAGDGVPSVKYEGPDINFHRTNPQVTSQWLNEIQRLNILDTLETKR